jgi:hypothetical protein
MVNVYINFWLHKSIAIDNKAPIKCRITVYGKAKDFSISEKIEPAKWNQEAQKAKGENDDAKRINTRISRLKNEIDKIVRKLEDSESEISSQIIINELKVKPQSIPKLLDLFQKEVIDKSILLGRKRGYIHNLRSTITLMRDFLQFKYQKDDINIADCNEEFWRGFQEDSLRVRPRKKFKNGHIITKDYKLSNNYIVYKLNGFSPVIKKALNKGWIKEGIADYIFIKLTKSRHKYLEQSELQAIANKEFSPLPYSTEMATLLTAISIPFTMLSNNIFIESTSLNNLNICRDICLAQAECGASFEAIDKLTEDNILLTHEGREILHYLRAKNEDHGGIEARQVISKELKRLINKYKDSEHRKITGKLFPVPSQPHYNRTLKKIQLLCGINKKLTTHVFRHTFGTLKAEEGWGREDIAIMMGHSNINTTAIYSKITNKRLINKSEELYSEKPKMYSNS